MKTKHTLVFIAGLSVSVVVQAQERVATADLPPAVQRALNEASKGDVVKTVHRHAIDGRTVYDVELERKNAINPRFRITEDGMLLSGAARTGSDAILNPALPAGPEAVAALDPMIPIEALPAPVRETIRREAAGRPVADIDQETWQGRTVYEIEFRAAGLNPQVHIAEDGAIVKSEQKPGGEMGASLRAMFMGTQFADTPVAVQDTIQREARGGVIKDIDLERRRGQRIYEVEINDHGNTYRMEIGEDGQVLHNTRPTSAPPLRG